MGKRIIAQRRGRGSPTFRAPSHKYKENLEHVRVNKNETVSGVVTEIVHDPARSAPIAYIRIEKEKQIEEKFVIVPEGITICNLEARPNDGGKFARASGNCATLLAHEQETGKTLVVMPSGKKKWLSSDCFATIGVVAGGGRTEKPFVKAGKKYHKMKTRAAKYPTVRGVAMNPVDHPFGGGGHQHVGKSKTPGRGAPPGRKVGSIAAKRTGYKR
jgi:large subunit ribosomal protein L2